MEIWDGNAKHIKNENLVYSEHRVYSLRSSANFSVKYLDQHGKMFAWKKVVFNENKWQPDFLLNDVRSNFFLKALVIDDSLKVELKENGEKTIFTKKINKSLVWDAGLDHFIKDNWDVLKKTPIEFELFVLEMGRSLDFKAAMEIKNGMHVVTLTPANFFIRLLADPMKITYSDTKEILAYKGVTDIKDPSGDNYVVQLEYQKREKKSK